jgi:hypothetical protein
MRDFDPNQFAEADRREVNPPIPVDMATWSKAGRLDWWVKERQEWLGRVRGADGRQRWIKAVDLRPANGLARPSEHVVVLPPSCAAISEPAYYVCESLPG